MAMRKQLKDICRGFTKNIALKDLGQHEGQFPIYGASGYIKDVDFYCCDTSYIGIVKDGSGVGRVDVYPGYSSLLGTMQYIVPNDEVDLQYLKYALTAMDLGSLYKGAAIPHIYFKEYGKFFVDLPDLETQKHISASLDTIQQAIDLKRKQLEDLDELVKSKFQEMFGDVSMNSKGYTVSNMLDVSYGGGQYGAASASIEKDLDRPRYIRITDIDDFGELNDDYVVSINVSDDNDYLLEYGDFLFARSGATVGKTYYYNTNERQIFAGYLIRFKLNLELVNPCFLFYYTKTDYYSTWVLSQQGGAAQPNINAKKYGSLPVLLPPISSQSTFADYVNKTNAAKQIIKHEISDLEELMDSKMDEYFG